MTDLEKKYNEIKQFIENKGKDGIAIAFSGGIDSSVLVGVCHRILGKKAVAVTAESPTYTSEELEDAKRIAKAVGIKLIVVETNELSNPMFRKNPENRCYFCKKELLKQIQMEASKLGFTTVFEGTNFSDLAGHRPGYLAVQELENVYSPWVVNKFTKKDIKEIAKKFGFLFPGKPSNSCLASRIAYNEEITLEKLERITRAEKIVKELTGVTQLRVRCHNDLARIEVPQTEIKLLCENNVLAEILEKLKTLGFSYVTVDLEGYQTGSMLRTLKAANRHG